MTVYILICFKIHILFHDMLSTSKISKDFLPNFLRRFFKKALFFSKKIHLKHLYSENNIIFGILEMFTIRFHVFCAPFFSNLHFSLVKLK